MISTRPLISMGLRELEIIIIILLFWEFFTPALDDRVSLESEWQKVYSNHQDFSQYTDRS